MKNLTDNVSQKNIKVSVCISAYNHQDFIVDALNSVLDQVCDFEYEVILSNDCSTDQTHGVITHFLKTHPKGYRVRYYDQPKNLGINRNLIFTLKEATGQYIALLEGDDYWTNPLKLQKQLDFLESNRDFSICTAAYEALTPTGLVARKYEGDVTGVIYDFAKITEFRSNYLNMFFRANCLEIENLKSFNYSGDNVIFLMCLQKGKGYFLNESLAFRRTHPGSAWTAKTQVERLEMGLEQLTGLYRYPVFKRFIRPTLLYTYLDLFENDKSSGNFIFKSLKLIRKRSELIYFSKVMLYAILKSKRI